MIELLLRINEQVGGLVSTEQINNKEYQVNGLIVAMMLGTQIGVQATRFNVKLVSMLTSHYLPLIIFLISMSPRFCNSDAEGIINSMYTISPE